MPSLKKTYNADHDAEVKGQWMPLAGGEVLIARHGNAAFNKAIAAASAPHRAIIAAGKATPEQIRDINAKGISEAILLGWRGFDEEYSLTAAYALLIDQPDFADDIMVMSQQRERFQKMDVQEAGPSS